jgi:hypothetical protein
MKHALSPYVAPLLAFGPLFMIGHRLPYSGDPFAVPVIVWAFPYVGAAMLSIGATSLLRAFQKQQKELAELRTKLAASSSA